MTEHIDKRSELREGIDHTALAVAAGHDGFLHEALESVSWERRGLLGRLTRESPAERSPESGA
jgi:hypothetical protein